MNIENLLSTASGGQMMIMLAVALSILGAGLVFLISWARKERSRYFYFDLCASLFIVSLGVALLFSPRQAVLPLWVVGAGFAVFGIWRSGLQISSQRRYGVARCTFCSKSQRQVEALVAGPGVLICNECVGICQATLAANSLERPDNRGPDVPHVPTPAT